MIYRCYNCKWWADNPNFKENWGACGAAKEDDSRLSVATGDMMTHGLFRCHLWGYKATGRKRGGQPGARIPAFMKDKALELYAECQSLKLTAETVGHSRATVRSWLIAAGLYRKKSGEEYAQYLRDRRSKASGRFVEPKYSTPSYSPPTSPQS